MTLDTRINCFTILGTFLHQFVNKKKNDELASLNDKFFDECNALITDASITNPWFTEKNVRLAIRAISQNLESKNFKKWIAAYPYLLNEKQKSGKVGVVMAGNIPLVGFHDMLCVLITGHTLIAKISSKDADLMKFISRFLKHLNPEFEERIYLTEDQISDFDAVIATGSNNTSRYFEYYFGKYPHIIRKNRHSAAILSGRESKDDLRKLADDVFSYFGLGCRNVSKLYVPGGYDVKQIYDAMAHYKYVYDHHKYANNYDYNKAVYMVNQTPHLDNGFILLKKDPSYASPLGTLFYEHYNSLQELKNKLEQDSNILQCIVSGRDIIENAVPFGASQFPELWEYADNIDTIKFLLSLQGL